MPHQPNWQEFGEKVGQDKPVKDATHQYDANYGSYKVSTGGKPTSAGPNTLPNTPSPFKLGGEK